MNQKDKKYIKIIIFILFIGIISTLLINTKSTFSYGENNYEINELEYEENEGELNPDWVNYNNLSDEEKSKVEVIPEKYIRYFNKDIHFEPYKDPLPSQYDLRNVNGNNYVTPVKNQSSLGLCWDFSGTAVIESYILKSGLSTNPIIFNERGMDYARATSDAHTPYNWTSGTFSPFAENYNPFGFNDDLLVIGKIGGGNYPQNLFLYASLGFALQPKTTSGRWSSYNTDHEQLSIYDIFNTTGKNYIVTGYVQYPYSTNISQSNKEFFYSMMKSHIIENGPLAVTTIAPGSKACGVSETITGSLPLIYKNEDCTANYVPEQHRALGTHAMTIIGWDDDYVQSYCALYREGKTTNDSESSCISKGGNYRTVRGVWILKNSWGTSTSGGYVHMAYDSLDYWTTGVTGMKVRDFDKFYYAKKLQNDTDEVADITNGSKTLKVKFKKGPNKEILKRVSLKSSTNDQYEYEIYLERPNRESVLLNNITINKYGLYNIEVNNLDLDDTEFTIFVKNKNGTRMPINVLAYTSVSGTSTTVNLDGELKYNNNNYNSATKTNLDFVMSTTNFNNHNKILYKLYAPNGTDITQKISNPYAYSILNDNVNRTVEIGERLSPGIYTLKAKLENGTQLASVDIPLGLTSIENTTIVINNNTTYTGQWNNGIITIANINGQTLTLNQDYTITGNDYNAGTHTLTINGIGSYSGTVQKTYTIKPKELSVTVKNKTIKYNETLPTNITTNDIQISGLVSRETPIVNGTYITNYTQGSNVGEYNLNANVNLQNNGNFKPSNYNVTVVPGKLIVERATLQYIVPTGITARKNQVLSEVNLPNGFEWMNPSAIVTKSGNYKARAFKPGNRNNYEEVENIDIYVTMINNEYTITFYANNGTNATVTQTVTGETSTALRTNSFTYSGYKFKNWNTKANGSGQTYNDKQEVSLTSDLKLYAQWVDEIDYIIKVYLETTDSGKNYITKIPVGTQESTFKSNITLGNEYTLAVETKTINNKKVLYTGGKTKIYKNGTLYKEFINVVVRDVNGTGKIDIGDLTFVYRKLIDRVIFSTIEYHMRMAADINGNNKIDIGDVTAIYRIISE